MSKIILYLDKTNQSSSIDELKELLNTAGISLAVQNDERGATAIFEVNKDEFIRKQTRYAGRPEILTEKAYTVGEVRQLKTEMTVDKLANILHLSKRTVFRRLKNHKYDPDSFLF